MSYLLLLIFLLFFAFIVWLAGKEDMPYDDEWEEDDEAAPVAAVWEEKDQKYQPRRRERQRERPGSCLDFDRHKPKIMGGFDEEFMRRYMKKK
jgi:hypothetical protein